MKQPLLFQLTCTQGINGDEFGENLTNKMQVTRGERIVTPLNLDQALDTRDALAKALYSNM